jgi:hypothetical protein
MLAAKRHIDAFVHRPPSLGIAGIQTTFRDDPAG